MVNADISKAIKTDLKEEFRDSTIEKNLSPQTLSSTTKKGIRLGLGRLGQKAKPPSSILATDKSYIGLKWKKTSKSTAQIFNQIEYANMEKLFNLEEFEKFIAKQNKPIVQSVKQEKAQETKSIKSCLEYKKNYALNIALGRVKYSNKVLLDKIYSHTFEDENIVGQLILYFPTDEEIQLINQSNFNLSKAEMLFKEANDIKSLYNSLTFLKFKFAFENRDFSFLFKKTSLLFDRILNSSELIKTFGILLIVGNVLNSNTFNSNAEGFSLDSLETFNNNAILDLISKKINKQQLVKDLTGQVYNGNNFSLCLDLSVDSIISEFNDVKSLFIENVVDQSVKDEFYSVLDDFKIMNEKYKKIQEYFGEKDDKFVVKLENFLKKLL